MGPGLRLAGATFVMLLTCRQVSAADVYLGLQAYTAGGKPLGVGLAAFTSTGNDADSVSAANKLRSVIREDLLFTRLFSVVENGPLPTGDKLDSLAWGAQGAQVVITGRVSLQGDQVNLECKIYDVSSGKILIGKQGSGLRSTVRRLAHLMSDQLIFQLSGQPGIAHTRIAFVNTRTGHKEIYVMDYDGAGIRQITSFRNITITPRWSPDGKKIAFTSYRAGNPDAYTIDANGGNLRELSARQGLNTAPAWSPDGDTVALTLSRGADPDIFLIDISGRIKQRLTYVPGVDTSPTFAPNGQEIAFVSDRAGNPELYVMDNTGANVQRLTYGQWVDAPAWSPRGDFIAYERQRGGAQYDIYVIDPNGKSNQSITQGEGRNEDPSWSPDGRFIAFTSNREGRRRIYVMGSDGSDPHAIGDISGESSMPSWGP